MDAASWCSHIPTAVAPTALLSTTADIFFPELLLPPATALVPHPSRTVSMLTVPGAKLPRTAVLPQPLVWQLLLFCPPGTQLRALCETINLSSHGKTP